MLGHLLDTPVYAGTHLHMLGYMFSTLQTLMCLFNMSAYVWAPVQCICICWGTCSVCLCILGHLYCVSGICCIFLPKLGHLLGTSVYTRILLGMPVYVGTPARYTYLCWVTCSVHFLHLCICSVHLDKLAVYLHILVHLSCASMYIGVPFPHFNHVHK